MAWFTDKDEAAALIGVDSTAITDTNLAMASSVIETFINREATDIPAISSRDLKHIRKAIAWQALFLADQEDYGYRPLLDSASTDGQTFNMVKRGIGGVDMAAQMLHPIAYRSLVNLSWKSKVVSSAPMVVTQYRTFLNETSDDTHGWGNIV